MLPGLQVHSQLVLLVLVDVLIELVQLLLLSHPDLLLGLLLPWHPAPPPGPTEGAAGPGVILNRLSQSEIERENDVVFVIADIFTLL